ncbi:hypothetical protein [Actinoallomurus sp. NPDC052274]|uniref:hypothetical protein n=1 Tax=Actinoallomurus sp. NPDC052274 TaxID=3155420 RepID=UPI00343A5078
MRRVKINVPGIGVVRAVYSDDWETGTTLYEVTATRVTGVFTVRAEHHWSDGLDPDTPYVRVGPGRPTGRRYDPGDEREDRPVVNGVRLCGDMVINTDRMREGRLKRWDLPVRRGRYGGSVPDLTAERTAAVVEGLLTHWLTRPEVFALRLAAVRVAAKADRHHLVDKAARERERFEEAQRSLRRAEEEVAKAELFAAMPPAATEDLSGSGLWCA